MLWPTVITLAVTAAALIALWLVGERGHAILPSTRATLRRFGVSRIIRSSMWHFYVYGCWPMQYIGFLIHFVFAPVSRFGDHAKRWLADRYHGKVLTHKNARSIIAIDREIPLQDLDQIIPYGTARGLLLETPLDMAVFECPCRHARANPCQPTQVCLIVGQPFVDLVLEHHPSISRRLVRAEALDLLEAEHQRGHVHVAWFKHACLDRFFAICNCCKCCCGGIDAMMNYGIPMMTSSGYVARVAQEVCLGCGTCESLCAFDAVHVDEVSQTDETRCMGCGVCVDHCPQDAISLTLAPDKGRPLDVGELPGV